MTEGDSFKPKLHAKYLRRYLDLMPSQAASLDSQRLTIAFFAISGLDVLDSLDVFNESDKQDVIEWVYRLQVAPDPSDSDESWRRCGFLGSSTISFQPGGNLEAQEYQCGHLAMTYTGLAILAIMGDDLSRVHKQAVIRGVQALQQPDGSFCATLGGSENDMRFIYCAACVCYMLQDWSGMNKDLAQQFILKSLTYEGGIAQGPGLEAHGGTTYCAVAALSLMGRLDCLSKEQMERLRQWCIARQISGFQGRPNKPADTCYSFWIGATLKLLGVFELIDFKENRDYIMSTQDPLTGGFSKWEDTIPDTLHTYFGICGLSLMGEEGLRPLHPGLNLSQRAADHLHELHRLWGID